MGEQFGGGGGGGCCKNNTKGEFNPIVFNIVFDMEFIAITVGNTFHYHPPPKHPHGPIQPLNCEPSTPSNTTEGQQKYVRYAKTSPLETQYHRIGRSRWTPHPGWPFSQCLIAAGECVVTMCQMQMKRSRI